MKEYDKSLFEYRDWHAVREIGAGSFGKVYEIQKEDFGYTYKSALKIISIPQPDQDLTAIKENIGKSDESLELYYESVKSEIVKEIVLMDQLKGVSNIVSYESHEVKKHQDDIGWDIKIQMELLTPLNTYMKTHPMQRNDIIQLGIDMCKALERCQSLGIIHRDIKPGNIFISRQGDFKLGDFGIARTIEAHNTVLEMSKKGTINYMAPEVFKGTRYRFDVDLYSLGIVLYRLLNNNTLPFMPLPPNRATYEDMERANQMRFSGRPLPYPVNDNTQLADVVMKACSFRSEDRYTNPSEMRKHLETILNGQSIHRLDAGTVLLTEQTSIGKSEWSISKKIGVGLTIAVICMLLISGITISFKKKNNETAIEQKVQTESSLESNNEGDKIIHDLSALIEQQDFVLAYKTIQDRSKAGENVDRYIYDFVRECEKELEYKRAVAAIKLLSDDIRENEDFYRETVQWFYDRDKIEFVRQILTDLRNHGSEGENLADIISSEYIDINYHEGEEKNEG